MLTKVSQWKVLRRLGFPDPAGHGTPDGVDDNGLGARRDESTDEEEETLVERASLLMNYCVHLGAQHTWTMLASTECPPDSFACVLLPDHGLAIELLAKVRQTWLNAQFLKEKSNVDDPDPVNHDEILKAVHTELHYLRQPTVIDTVRVCEFHDWNPASHKIREQAWYMFAGISCTKRVNEDVFGCLADTKRCTKNGKVSRAKAFWRAANAPTVLHPGEFDVEEEMAAGRPIDRFGSVQLTREDWQGPTHIPNNQVLEGMFEYNRLQLWIANIKSEPPVVKSDVDVLGVPFESKYKFAGVRSYDIIA